jgi:hypothetical protein
MVQKLFLFLRDQTCSTKCEYDILKVWFNKIYHNMSIKGVKVGKNILLLVPSREVSGDGLIYLWCLNYGTLIIINHFDYVNKYD